MFKPVWVIFQITVKYNEVFGCWLYLHY